jgi:hypothetical protein
MLPQPLRFHVQERPQNLQPSDARPIAHSHQPRRRRPAHQPLKNRLRLIPRMMRQDHARELMRSAHPPEQHQAQRPKPRRSIGRQPFHLFLQFAAPNDRALDAPPRSQFADKFRILPARPRARLMIQVNRMAPNVPPLAQQRQQRNTIRPPADPHRPRPRRHTSNQGRIQYAASHRRARFSERNCLRRVRFSGRNEFK